MQTFSWAINGIKHPRALCGTNLAQTLVKSQQWSLCIIALWPVWSRQGTCCGPSVKPSLTFLSPQFSLKNEAESPVKTPPGTANYFMPDRGAEMPPHTSDFFFSSQLIVLPKLNDLFLELKEMQCREKGTDKAQDREGR